MSVNPGFLIHFTFRLNFKEFLELKSSYSVLYSNLEASILNGIRPNQ